MSPALSLDTTSKRWLTVLAVAVVISIIMLTRSFISAFSRPEAMNPETQKTAAAPAVTASTTAEPEWNLLSQSPGSTVQHIHPDSSSETSDFGRPKRDAAIRKEQVHKQAQDLRSMVKQNKLPKSFGHLTTEQIDEMEKKGIIIE